METDLHWYLKGKCNFSPEDINYFINVFRGLMNSETEIEFDSEWNEIKKNQKFLSCNKVCQYFEGNLIPSFKLHASIWVLKAAGIPNPENGITNNPSESMNAVLHRLQQWKQVPLDVIAISLYHLSTFYYREIERSIHQCGHFKIKDQFDYLKREPSLMPRLQVAIDPKEIVDKVLLDENKQPPTLPGDKSGQVAFCFFVWQMYQFEK